MKRHLSITLAILSCLLLLLGCAPKQVQAKSVKVLVNGVSTECLYSGEFQFKPVGAGTYTVTTDDDEWTFTGQQNKDKSLTDGNVEDMPYTFKSDGNKYDTYYTGEVKNLEPVGAITITDYPYTLQYEGEDLEGSYDGEILNAIPDGQGSFSYEDKGDYFEYDGAWKAGALVGEGTIDSNIFIIHFPDVDRTGEFEGSVIAGVPNGEGDFSASNRDNVDYTYTGDWANGLFDGQGKLVYDSDDLYVCEGNFHAGGFAPSIADFYTCLGTRRNSSFMLSDNEIEFIESHESMFNGQAQEVDDAFIDKTFKYELFSKNQAAFDRSIIKVSGLRVIQILEDDYYGYPHTLLLAEDSKYRVYYINLIGTASNIVEGTRIQLVTLPVDYFTYITVSQTQAWAIACIGISVSKQ